MIFTATVSVVAPGAGLPLGDVEFFDGATSLGNVSLSGGNASLSVSSLSVGNHIITAVYGGDINFNGNISLALSQNVNNADTSISVTSSANPSVFGQSVTFTATVNAVAPGVGTPTGNIIFKDGATILGTGILSSDQATFSTPILSAGQHSITAVYSGDINFSTNTSSILTQTVTMATPIIIWSDPANIVYGTALDGTQLNATASVVGNFTYTPPAGTVLGAGTQTLYVDFTPSDTANYTGATKDVTLIVQKATPTINWNNPEDIIYGTILSSTQLNATASVPGSFVYTPALGTVLSTGANQNLHVDFTPTDTTNYTNISKDVIINIQKATPTITWGNPEDIVFGTALSSTQLNAIASVPGVFVYTPALGTVLGAGEDQILHVNFTPEDSTNYSTTSKNVLINVMKALLSVTADNKSKIYGAALPELTASYSGLVLGETPSVLDGTLTFSTTATASSTMGTYPITPSGLTSSNYDITFRTGMLTITKADTTIKINSSINPSIFGQSVTFTAMVSAVAPGAGTPSGTVQFKIDNSNIGLPVALSSGNATSINTSSLSVGTHTITTEYSGDNNFNSSTSSALIQTVNRASTTIISGASTGGSGCGRNVNSKENLSNIKQYEYSRDIDVYVSNGITVFSFTTLGIVNEVGFTAKTNEECITARGELLKGRPSQATSDALGIGTVYFNVWVDPWGYGESSKIKNQYIVFSVHDKGNNESVKLMMYKDSSWIDLKTERISADTYKAYTSGFGSFAIVAISETSSETLSQPVITSLAITNEPMPDKPVNLSLIIVLLVAIAIMTVIYRRYRKGLSRKN